MDVFQLVDGNGEFNYSGVTHFMNATRMDKRGLKYSVISILGPKNSGKSTLLNHLFGVNFKSDLGGSSLDDKGIWLAKSTSMANFTVVMDLQSIIGKDDRFEKQSIIFALAVSDIVLINMWSLDLEKKNATIFLLLCTIFQVMWHLSSQSKRKTKITLVFVIRDTEDVYLNYYEKMLRASIQKIWDGVVKPTNETSPPTEFFYIEVVTLESYKENKELFERQVEMLRALCYAIIYGQLSGNREGIDLAPIFSRSTQEIWKFIKDDQPLNFNDLKVIILDEYCKRVADEKFLSFCHDEKWLNIKRLTPSEAIQKFPHEVYMIIQKHFNDYDVQVCHFESSCQANSRENLKSCITEEIQRIYTKILDYMLDETINEFKNMFDIENKKENEYSDILINCTEYATRAFEKKCDDVAIEGMKINLSIFRTKLFQLIRDHVALVCTAKEAKEKSYEQPSFYEKVMTTIFGNKKTTKTSSNDLPVCTAKEAKEAKEKSYEQPSFYEKVMTTIFGNKKTTETSSNDLPALEEEDSRT